MLQIKNTLGGGKPEGLYAWKKSSVACIDSITTQTGKNYTLGNATSDTTVYYSTSYTFDETTGTYTLVNPKSATLQYMQWGVYSVEMVKSNYYIWGSTSSNEIYNTNASSTYTVYIKNSNGSVFLEADSSNYKYDIHSAKIEYTFLDYVVSDKENAYPNGGEKDGYWYERVSEGITPEMFGATKKEEQTFTVSSSVSEKTITHSLGEIPKLVLCFPSDATCSESVGPFGTLILAMMRMYQGSKFNSYPGYGVYAGIYSPSDLETKSKGYFSGNVIGDMFPSNSQVKLHSSANFISGYTYNVILLG